MKKSNYALINKRIKNLELFPMTLFFNLGHHAIKSELYLT